jgi:small subunit ribosomal protein S6
MPTRYELLYILPTTLTDDEVGGIESKVNATLTKVGAVIESTKRLGKFKLAYPIKGQRHGHYVLVFFTAETSTVTKIDELLRIMPEMVRHLTLRADEAGEQKFDLVQFAEIVVEGGREERRRRERAAEKEEAKKTEEAPKKIESALSDDVKGV